MTTRTDVRIELTPYLAVPDARAALEFYRLAFGAVVTLEPIVMDDGRIGHVELGIGPAEHQVRVMMADEFPEIGVVAPNRDRSAVALHLQVPDVDATVVAAVAAGAELLREVADQGHGNRNATILDPSGHRWMISTPLATS